MRLNKILKLIIALVVSELAGIIGAVFTTPSIATWYATLPKPALNPPSWVFGPVWTMLYALIGISLFLVWKNDWRVVNALFVGSGKAWNKLSQRLWTGNLQKVNVIALFWVQWALNVAWSILFFGLHSPGLALFEIVVLWISIVYVIINFWRVSKAAAWLLVPYILWVTFAGYLNFSIWYLSPATSGSSVACTQEAKLCPDGSAVGRTGPDCAFAPCPSAGSTQGPGKDWKTITDTTTNATFQYPESLGTTYIHALDWPPRIQVLNQPFACTQAGSETAPAGKTEQRMVDNRVYCVTTETQGAAGSIYTQYAYAFARNNATVILTFTTRSVQCGNYDDPQKTACENERTSFDLDGLVDRIAQTISYGVAYTNAQYHFSFALPDSWKGYAIVTSTWEGDAVGPGGDAPVASGPIISIRSPRWTATQPLQDIPIMVFTPAQWDALQREAFHIGAAPIGPSVLASSSAYVFALPARYNYAFLPNYQEVQDILAGHPLHAF